MINARERLPRSTRAPAVKARSCPTPEQRRTALREGGAIKRRRNQRNPYSEKDAMAIFVQLNLALEHVHAQRILHRAFGRAVQG